MSGVVVAVACALLLYAGIRQRTEWHPGLLRACTVLLLTLLPGMLYLRFLRQRLKPLSTEYVYNLHRLRLDHPAYLPEPPRASKFHARWEADGGADAATSHNIYRMKFQTQYGRWPRSDREESGEVWGSILPVYICTVVVGVGLAAVVWYPPTSPTTSANQRALAFGFLGAYFFVLSTLIRRYFQNDLRPGAYLAAAVRIITVLLLVAAVMQLLEERHLSSGSMNAVAFGIGIFPTVALQLIRKALGRTTGWARGGTEPQFPLGQLDGVDIWTETRLLEVGIEDVQHLAFANLVDVSLATRIPMQRIVDWVDQALLLLHAGLPRSDNHHDSTYLRLRQLGIRTATDVVLVVQRLGMDLGRRENWPTTQDPAFGGLVEAQSSGKTACGAGGLLTQAAVIAHVISKEPNFTLVRNWQLDGDEPPGPRSGNGPSRSHGALSPASAAPIPRANG